MPVLVFDILLVVINGFLVFQDFKTRSISILLLSAHFLVLIGFSVSVNGFEAVLDNFLYNMFYVLALFGVLYAYFLVFLKKSVRGSFFKTSIGLGDFFYLISLSPLWDTYFYILFLVLSFSIALLYAVLSIYCRKQRNPSIPLVAFLGIGFIISRFFSMF